MIHNSSNQSIHLAIKIHNYVIEEYVNELLSLHISIDYFQECNKSICTLISKAECTLTIPNMEDPLRQRDVDREYLCHIGCFESKSR